MRVMKTPFPMRLSALLLGSFLLVGTAPVSTADEIPPPPADDASIPAVKPEPPKAKYQYRVPKKLADGWKVGDLRKEKADFLQIGLGMDQVQAGAIPGIHSLLVARDGKVLLEEYFNGFKAEGLNPLFSCTKSVFATVYAIAQDQGLLNVDQKLFDLYPEVRSEDGWDPKKDGITVGMLLSMTSGLDCNDADPVKNCNVAIGQTPDWLDFCLGLSLANPPGKAWAYNGTCLVLLSNLIAKKSGISYSEFAEKNLLAPLGIKGSTWTLGPKGVARVDSGLAWKTRDMAKLGQLYLDKGMWEGKRIFSETWVKEASTVRCPMGAAFAHEYGYLWHIKSMWWKDKWINVFYANGYKGQDVFVSPEAGLVCVMTADSDNNDVYRMEEGFFQKAILASFL